MPCDGITVAMWAQERALDSITNLCLETGIRIINQSRSGNITKLAILLPNGLPVSIAITTSDGESKVIAITQKGTFEGGIDALKEYILAALNQRGADIKGVKFETHNHNKNAPQLSYNVKLNQ